MGTGQSVWRICKFGDHTMMGTLDGVLNHLQPGKNENLYWHNDVKSEELVQCADIANSLWVPPSTARGDDATCHKARKFFSNSFLTVVEK